MDLKHSWDAYVDNDPFKVSQFNAGVNTSRSSNYIFSNYLFSRNDILHSVISRIALDASLVEFRHVKHNLNNDKIETIDTDISRRLNRKANIDQTGRNFIYDAVWSLLEEGTIAIVADKANVDPLKNNTFNIESFRVGKIKEWFSYGVTVEIYNEKIGRKFDLKLPKDKVAIIESPLYSVFRANSMTLRLIEQKLNLMKRQDENQALGKLNGFLRLPYRTNATRRKDQAERRREELETEMANSTYGIATLDNNEEYISAGGGINNNVLDDIRNLKQDFYNELGITSRIIDGTASTSELNLYYYRTVDPVLQAIADGLTTTFLTDTAITQGQQITFYRDPFKLMSVEAIATSADLLLRNATITPNETRAVIGRPPHPSPLADMLFNRNIADANQNGGIMTPGQGQNGMPEGEGEVEQITIYSDGNGGYVDEQGNPVDEQGNPIS